MAYNDEPSAYPSEPARLATVEADPPGVQGRHKQLAEEIERLAELVGRLDERLTPVLRPIEPKDDAKLAQAIGPESAVASLLRDRASAISSVSDQLLSILHRIDL